MSKEVAKMVVNPERRLTINYYWYFYGQCPFCGGQIADSYKLKRCRKCNGKFKWPFIVPKVRTKKNNWF